MSLIAINNRPCRGLAVVFFLTLGLVAKSNAAEDDDWGAPEWDTQETPTLQWGGYSEMAIGERLQQDSLQSGATLGELRQRINLDYQPLGWQLQLKLDLNANGVQQQLETELREALLSFSASEHWDIKLGHQVLSWGTGQYLFINDLFPKDWQSFFNGRDDEYLKAPVTAAKASYFSRPFNLDLVWMPTFSADRYLNGEYFSYYDPNSARQVAPSPALSAQQPDGSIEDTEIALRLFKTVDAVEYALYGYRGYWKSPLGRTSNGDAYHPRLNVWGASIRAPLGPGIGNIEWAWYDSRDDSNGTNPAIPNGQQRLLLGYDQELKPRLNAAIQFYLEATQDYAALLNNTAPNPLIDKYRQLWSLALRYRNRQDNLTLNGFAFYSPSDNDFYLRPTLSYRIDDRWQFSAGFNLMGGKQAHTSFAQLQDGSNAFLKLRYRY